MPWAAARCVTRWRDDRVAKGVAKWRAAAHAASKQSRRPHVPEVTDLMTTREVCGLLGDADLALVLHEQARRPLAELQIPRTGTVAVVVGPRAGSPTARWLPSALPVPRPCASGPRCCARPPRAPQHSPPCRCAAAGSERSALRPFRLRNGASALPAQQQRAI